MDETLRQWGENIRIHRELLNGDANLRRSDEPAMTQAELGRLLEPAVGQSTVARWEKGYFEPRRHYKAQLAHVLHTDVRILFAMVRAS